MSSQGGEEEGRDLLAKKKIDGAAVRALRGGGFELWVPRTPAPSSLS